MEPVGHGIREERDLSQKRELCLLYPPRPSRRMFSLLSTRNFLISAAKSTVQYCVTKTISIFLCDFSLTNIETQCLLFGKMLRYSVTCSIFWVKELGFGLLDRKEIQRAHTEISSTRGLYE